MIKNIFATTSISGSGLAAERLRMEVAANNIANANTTRTAGGGAYRRQNVIFEAAMDEALQSGRPVSPGLLAGMNGVQISGVAMDQSPLPKVYHPGHPDANADGFVEMPNVKLAHEMVDLMTASRAYEANLKSLHTFRQMTEQALSLMRSTG